MTEPAAPDPGTVDPDSGPNAAILLTRLARPLEALAAIDADLAQRPDNARGHAVRAHVLRALARLDEALAACDRALEIQDDQPAAWCARAFILLTQGNYAEGWPLYEWRWLDPDIQTPIAFPPGLWDGAPLRGRSLAVIAEQGLGDSIQFFRFVVALSGSGPVGLRCPEALVSLFAAQTDALEVTPPSESVPRADAYCMMGSLPWILGVELDSLAARPYLRADAGRAADRERRLPPGQRIGLVWSGNPAHADTFRRSVPLDALLAQFDGAASLVTLQNETTDEDRLLLANAPNVVVLGHELNDFQEIAAVVDRLDLVVTVDTVFAHLAGAMGKPVWILLEFAPDWRWLLDREDSPWYPSARLFRQRAPGDWSVPLARLRAALRERFPPK